MSKLDEIKNRRLSQHGIAFIEAMAGNDVDVQTETELKNDNPIPESVQIDNKTDVEFYGARVQEFYEHFSRNNSQSIASNLALAATVLKSSVVIGGVLKDLSDIIKHINIAQPKAIDKLPVKLPYTGKKRGRKPKIK